MRLLIVEDEHGLASALKVGLTREGYAVDLAHTVTEATESSPTSPTTWCCSTSPCPTATGSTWPSSIRRGAVECLTGPDLRIVMLTARGGLPDRVQRPRHRRRRLPGEAVRPGRAEPPASGPSCAARSRRPAR